LDKRNFIKALGGLSISPFLTSSGAKEFMSLSNFLPKITDDEELWKVVRSHYKLKDEYINLESGYYCILPQPTLEHFIEHVRYVNYEGAYYMREYQFPNKDKVAAQLAEFVNTNPEELVITRNATESLDLIISGFPWKNGDEAIYAEQDYGAMINQFKLVAKREGIINKVISVPNHPKSDEEIVSLYENQITSKTKLIMVCHQINITGQILPIRKICDMAHSYGVDVLVDGAHCVGQFDVSIDDLNCDYYASSLHKWLSTPLGAGLLYVNKKNISKIWPFFASGSQNLNDIKRLNHTGTHPVHTDIAISNAIDYINWIGVKKKEERLRFLQRYWSDKLRGKKNVLVNTPEDIQRSCGIGNVGLKNIKPGKMAQLLFDEYKIFTVAIDGANVHGCRISPNIFTTTEELDSLVNAVTELSQISS